jgi:predicted nucleotidyltransferase
MSSHIDDFKEFIRKKNAKDTFRRYILHNDCQMIESNQSFELKNKICGKLNVQFDNVIVVGSCKLGFSIKPTKRFVPFGDDSDIDVAIVSQTLFESVWKTAIEYDYSNADWQSKREFFKYLASGWIRPDKFPRGENFAFSTDWFEFFSEMTNSREFGDYKIAAGIYYNSFFLEKYQETCLEQCIFEVTQ